MKIMDNIKTEFLFYQLPEEYLSFDGEEDPQKDELYNQLEAFQSFLPTCSLEKYLSLIISLFIEKYPDVIRLLSTLGSINEETDIPYFDKIFRSEGDIQNIIFTMEELDDDEYNNPFISDIKFIFNSPNPERGNWIEKAIENSDYSSDSSLGKTIYSFLNGPVLSIENEEGELVIKLNPNSFIDYIPGF